MCNDKQHDNRRRTVNRDAACLSLFMCIVSMVCWRLAFGVEARGGEGWRSEVSVEVLWVRRGLDPMTTRERRFPLLGCGPVGVATGWSGSSQSGPGWPLEGWVGRWVSGIKEILLKAPFSFSTCELLRLLPQRVVVCWRQRRPSPSRQWTLNQSPPPPLCSPVDGLWTIYPPRWWALNQPPPAALFPKRWALNQSPPALFTLLTPSIRCALHEQEERGRSLMNLTVFDWLRSMGKLLKPVSS